MSRIAEIYAAVLPVLEENNLEDTTENRILVLTGISHTWAADKSVSFEKSLYQFALAGELTLLAVKRLLNK